MRNGAWSARCLNFVALMFLVTQADLLLDLMFDMFVMLVDIGEPIDCPWPRAPLISVCVILDNFCFMLDVISFTTSDLHFRRIYGTGKCLAFP